VPAVPLPYGSHVKNPFLRPESAMAAQASR